MIYKSGIKAANLKTGPAYWFIFYRDQLMISASSRENMNRIPYFEDIGMLNSTITDIQYLGSIDGRESYAATTPEIITREGCQFVGLRQLFGGIEDDWYWLANRAFHLVGWRKKNRFCGCCGSEMSESGEEVALVCLKCGNIVYPRISPAVIVAITKGEQILLAHAAKFTGKMYSTIAGFVEAGETLEECVRREIMEEVGLRVKNIHYFSSQPWPYPDSLMIAFTAEYESGEIRIDKKEITDANWYSRSNLPELPLKVSVASKLIHAWLSR